MKLESGKTYKWTGGTERPTDWNDKGRMDAMLDGKPRKYTSDGSGPRGNFEGIAPSAHGGWTWFGDHFEEVESHMLTMEQRLAIAAVQVGAIWPDAEFVRINMEGHVEWGTSAIVPQHNSMKIPRLPNGKVNIKVRAWGDDYKQSTEGYLAGYFGGAKYPVRISDILDRRYPSDANFKHFEVIKEKEKELVRWSDEELKMQVARHKDDPEYFVIILHADEEKVYFDRAFCEKEEFFKDYVQTDGKPFLKETE